MALCAFFPKPQYDSKKGIKIRCMEKEMAIYFCILAWSIPMGRGAWWAIVHEVGKKKNKV